MIGKRLAAIAPRGSRGCIRRRRPRSQAGFNLLLVITFVTVLNVAVAAVLPRWSHVMQRAREQELIFRGIQYAEAIRIFQARFGRYPVSLDELIEVNPRCIRQLWKDPMHPEGKWELIRAEAQSPAGSLGDDDDDEEDESGRTGQSRRDRRRRDRNERDQERRGQGERMGPVLGVRSLVDEPAIIRFAGGSKYSDWRFTPELIEMPAGVLGMENVPRLYSRYLGRPMPDGITLPEAGGAGTGLDQPTESTNPTEDTRNRRNRRDRGGRSNPRGNRDGGR